jgi:N-acetylneuraminic acid mutarotase
MAYDAQADRVILFGGVKNWPIPLSDTWAYDPEAGQWKLMHPQQSPKGLGSMVYDSHAGRIVLYVYSTNDTTHSSLDDVAPLGETWTYDFKTDTWINRQAAGTPLGLFAARLAYDSESNRVILFGGADYPKGDRHAVPLSNDTWTYDYDSNAWTKATPKVKPPARALFAMTYDETADRVIVFGGYGEVWNEAHDVRLAGDTWAYDCNADTWTEMKPTAAPGKRGNGSIVYDHASQRDILVGGDNPLSTTYLADTWAYEFKSNTWTDLSPTPGPAPLAWHGMALIPTTKQIVAFVGSSDFGYSDTRYWLYDIAANQWKTVVISP